MHIYGLAANGMGGIDWQALPMLCRWLGISDIDGLIHRLTVIRLHRKPEGAN